LGENVEALSLRDAADRAIQVIEKLSNDVSIPRGLKWNSLSK